MAIPDVSNKKLPELISLRGRRAVITGGAKGIGRAIGKRFAEAGASVVLADLDEAEARRVAAEIGHDYDAEVTAMRVDASDSASIAALAQGAGAFDIWVNNAGIFPNKPTLQMEDAEWDRVLNLNLRGSFIGCREAARSMVAGKRAGVIINMASVAGLRGVAPSIAHYVTSKHGVIGLTKQMAVEFGPHNIRVLGVAPTTIATEGIVAAIGETPDKGLLGRAGQPDDVARVVLFCVSDLAAYLTGDTLPVDGGRLTLG